MPSAFRTQKNLSEWVELDYYRRQRRLKRWRRLFGWSILVVCLAGAALAAVLPRSQRLVQAGPLSSAHAMFNDDCGRCHEAHFQTVKKFTDWDPATHVVSDRACTSCHEGPAHNEAALNAPACAECHREHRGKLSLARVADGHCLACHADLQNHRQGGAAGLKFVDVKSFQGDAHPEFALHRNNRTDPGQIHFNHQKHLKDGGIHGREGKEQLKCVDCHKPDSAGRYMKPINYEYDCARCHPLSIQIVGNSFAPAELKAKVDAFNAKCVPHRKPEIVRGVLRERLLQFVQDNHLAVGEARDNLFDPGMFGKRSPSDTEWQLARREQDRVEGRLFAANQKDIAEDVLFRKGGGCIFCHIEEKRTAPGPELSALPVYKDPGITKHWMDHARFSHERHRMLDCLECHKAKDSAKTSDVLMPKIQSCQRCHNPDVGVRSDCAECHSYHARPKPHELHKTLTIGECLGR